MNIVLDASVVLKWLLLGVQHEPEQDDAVTICEYAFTGKVTLCQPVHWLAEVGAGMARLAPDTAAYTIGRLDQLRVPTIGRATIWRLATTLSVDLPHHLFDTLYHAVALETDSVLITADHRYLAKANHLGAVAGLADWRDVLAE